MEENQSYEIEKKEGNIVKIEDASEKQKQQKIKLKKTIATFCVGVGIAIGAGTLIHSTYENKKETMSTMDDYQNGANKIETFSRSEMVEKLVASGLTKEEAEQQAVAAEEKSANEAGLHTELELMQLEKIIKDNPNISRLGISEIEKMQLSNHYDYMTANNEVYLEYTRDKNNDGTYTDWVSTGKISIGNNNDSDLTRHQVIGFYKEGDVIYREQIRDGKIDNKGNIVEVGEWMDTSNYIVNLMPPADTYASRYIIEGIIKDGKLITGLDNQNSEQSIDEGNTIEEIGRSR